VSEEDRTTDSGIYLPEPSPDKGNPIAQLLFDQPGFHHNTVAPTDDDVRELARRVTEAQYALARGEEIAPLEVREPQWGKINYILPEGIRHTRLVCRAFAVQVDPFAVLEAEKERHFRTGNPIPSSRRHRN